MKEALKDTSISTQAKVEKVKRLKALTVDEPCPTLPTYSALKGPMAA